MTLGTIRLLNISMEDDPDKQRKWEDREMKRQIKKKAPKMKQLKVTGADYDLAHHHQPSQSQSTRLRDNWPDLVPNLLALALTSLSSAPDLDSAGIQPNLYQVTQAWATPLCAKSHCRASQSMEAGGERVGSGTCGRSRGCTL
uniref:Uncharacterized protein n=1 Tax=Timema cristinae TaxID=61476 RepID=A0A7R9CG24_TIMCR|nr:unnamed protein product [Timema cristinae]